MRAAFADGRAAGRRDRANNFGWFLEGPVIATASVVGIAKGTVSDLVTGCVTILAEWMSQKTVPA